MPQFPPDRYVQTNGISTRYWSLGTQGSAVLFIHGIGSAIETWALNVAPLAQQHQVYALDLVGAGRSEKPSGVYSLTALAEFVKAFANTLNLDRLSLIGNSLGGGVALQFALAYPQRVEKLVLVNSLGFGRAAAWGLRLANLPWVEQLYKPTRSSTAFTLKQAVANPAIVTDEWVNVFYELLSLPGASKTSIAQTRANVGWSGVRPEIYQTFLARLPALTTPTLIIWGQQDRLLPVAQAHVAVQRLPKAQLQIFDPCGHWAHFERADDFNARVAEFLSS